MFSTGCKNRSKAQGLLRLYSDYDNRFILMSPFNSKRIFPIYSTREHVFLTGRYLHSRFRSDDY